MPTINAGASGGIMGINAFLLVIALSPKYRAYLNAKSLFFMLAINLIIGFAISGINNAGHIGGAILGAIFGIVIAFLSHHRHWLIGGLWVVLVAIFAVIRQFITQSL